MGKKEYGESSRQFFKKSSKFGFVEELVKGVFPSAERENAWIGANTVIIPGVKIGENAVIGAGSVVTKDIPDDVVAVGNPCHVLRQVGEHDRVYFYRQEKIDWEEL